MKHPFKAIVTGSRAYGSPKPDSDIDLVVFVTEEEFNLLDKMADSPSPEDLEKEQHYTVWGGGRSLRFGQMNLLCVTNEKHYEVWRRGTVRLKKRARDKGAVDRVAAITAFGKMRMEEGLTSIMPPHLETAKKLSKKGVKP